MILVIQIENYNNKSRTKIQQIINTTQITTQEETSMKYGSDLVKRLMGGLKKGLGKMTRQSCIQTRLNCNDVFSVIRDHNNMDFNYLFLSSSNEYMINFLKCDCNFYNYRL